MAMLYMLCRCSLNADKSPCFRHFQVSILDKGDVCLEMCKRRKEKSIMETDTSKKRQRKEKTVSKVVLISADGQKVRLLFRRKKNVISS